MFNKIKEYIMNLPVKKGLVLLVAVFFFVILASKWYEYQSQTIAQTMVLHHNEKETE